MPWRSPIGTRTSRPAHFFAASLSSPFASQPGQPGNPCWALQACPCASCGNGVLVFPGYPLLVLGSQKESHFGGLVLRSGQYAKDVDNWIEGPLVLGVSVIFIFFSSPVLFAFCLSFFLSFFLSFVHLFAFCRLAAFSFPLSVLLVFSLAVCHCICLSVCLSFFLPFFLSSFLPFFLPFFLSFFLSSFLPSFRSFFLSSFPPVFLSSFLPFFLPFFFSFFLSFFLSFFIYLFIYLFIYVLSLFIFVFLSLFRVFSVLLPFFFLPSVLLVFSLAVCHCICLSIACALPFLVFPLLQFVPHWGF